MPNEVFNSVQYYFQLACVMAIYFNEYWSWCWFEVSFYYLFYYFFATALANGFDSNKPMANGVDNFRTMVHFRLISV